MEIYSETLDALVESTCRQVNDWVSGTATSGSSSTLADTSLVCYGNDYFNDQDAWIYVRSGDAAGNYRKISDFASTGGVITVTPDFSAAIVAGVTYSIHHTRSEDSWHRPDVVAKINLAIQRVAEKAHVWHVDTTSVTLAARTYEYDLPLTFMGIYRVTMADADGAFHTQPEIPPSEYWIIPSSTPKIHFRRTHADHLFSGHYLGVSWAETDFTATRKLRIEGLGSPATLTTDASVCPISPTYITFQAAAWLHAMKIRSAENDPDEHRTQFQVCQAIAEVEKAEVVGAQLPINYRRCRE